MFNPKISTKIKLTVAMTRRTLPTCLAASLALAPIALALTTARPAAAAPITYTGQLLSGTNPVPNGHYDFQFGLYTAATGGSQVGSTLSVPGIVVTGGVFYAEPDFGAAAAGQTLYLQTAYRLTGGVSYTTQTPRKLIPTTPYADYALVSGSANALQGKPVSATAPTTGQTLTWNGSLWTPASAAGGAYSAGAGLALSGTTFSVPTHGIKSAMISLPLALSANSSSPLFSVANANAAAGGNHTVEINGGATAIYGATTVTGGTGVQGVASSGTSAYGVYGLSNDGRGVDGVSNTGFGVYGVSANGAGVRGESSNTGDFGLLGGVEPTYNLPAGVIGTDASSVGFGVFGSSTGGKAVYGKSLTNDGVSGISDSGNGLYGSSNSGNGVKGVCDSGLSAGVYGSGFIGVQGSTDVGYGVFAQSVTGYGVAGISDSGDGLYGYSNSGYAGYLEGDALVTHNLQVDGDLTITGTLTAGTKDFKIDHPLDPTNKYLSHACIESNEMADLYSGNAVTDVSGNAVVTMPEWFQALNKDFRYQLTVIGQFAQAVVSSEMEHNQFAIKTDKPNVKVSWQVTGIRQDAYAAAHPLQVEEDKPAAEQGLYLHPKEWNQPEARGIGYARSHALKAHSRN